VSVKIVNVQGLDELQRTLTRTLPDKLQGRAMQAALTKGARPIITKAKALAPQDTGRLKRAIYAFRDKASTRTREGRLISVRTGKRLRKSNRDAFYWKWIEFGHRTRASKTQAGVVRLVPARPFMRPAFEAKKLAALEIIRQTLAGEIATVARKAAARSQSRLLNALRRTVAGF
jgi:HK97 gp10 family phage protein